MRAPFMGCPVDNNIFFMTAPSLPALSFLDMAPAFIK
jgi:hypothetical protein